VPVNTSQAALWRRPSPRFVPLHESQNEHHHRWRSVYVIQFPIWRYRPACTFPRRPD